MEKNTKILIGVASVLAVGGLLYAFRGKLFGKKDATTEGTLTNEEPTAPQLTDEQKNALVSANLALTNPLAALFLNTSSKQAYQVKTLGSNLNIRKTPSAKSEIVKKVANGSTLFGSPSQVAGWYQVSEDGNNMIGFASSLYLFKK
jgi:uncharacterized protein YgiM (DUF1202 family)